MLTRREILKTLWAALLLPSVLLPKRRMEPFVPQPKTNTEDLVYHPYFDNSLDEMDEGFLSDVGQAYDVMFWDVPDWAEDWELIDGVWYWV